MQTDFYIKNSINKIYSLLDSEKIKTKELLEFSNNLHQRLNNIYKFAEVFDADKSNSDCEVKGIPYLAKDIYNTKFFKTEMGSVIWKNFRPGNNARIIDNLNSAGFILIGKTVTSEFAIHAKNRTLNPFNKDRKVGTSSSGSAVAVALGIVPFALGTQTAGSIIRPSSFCGIFGMKPTYGLLPRTGILKTTDTLDNPGFMTSNINSLKVILDSSRLKGKNYPFIYRYIDQNRSLLKKPFKIGFIKTKCWDYAQNYIKDGIKKLLKKIENNSNYQLLEIDEIKDLSTCHDCHETIYDKCISYYFSGELEKYRDEISLSTKLMNERGSKIGSTKYLEALEFQKKITKLVNEKFSNFDAVISISTGSIAPKLNINETIDPSLIWTLAGIPSVNVPLELHNDMPYGVQFVASKYKDYQLINILKNLANDNIIRSYSFLPKDLLDINTSGSF